MSLSDLASVGSLVSGAAVLASLIYLGQQIRQSSRNQRAEIHQARLHTRMAYIDKLASPGVISLVRRGGIGDKTLSDEACEQFVLHVMGDFFAYEEWFLQHRDAMLDDRRWTGNLNSMRSELRFPGFRAAWQVTRPLYDPEFARFVDGELTEIPCTTSPEMFANAWRAAVGDEWAKAIAANDSGSA